MRRLFLAGAALLCLAVPSLPLHATPFPKPPQLPSKVAKADAIFVGKIKGFGKRVTLATVQQYSSQKKALFGVAEVEVEEALVGVKKGDKVRVGILMITAIGQRNRKPIPMAPLAKDQEALFYVVQHPEDDLLVFIEPADVLIKGKSNDYDKELKEARKWAKYRQDPMKYLKSKDAEERLIAAGMLLTHHSIWRPGKWKMEQIDKKESKLILEALAGADWSYTKQRDHDFSPGNLWFLLSPKEKDGWKAPGLKNNTFDLDKVIDAEKKWLKDNADKYRIKRTVPDRPEKTDKKTEAKTDKK